MYARRVTERDRRFYRWLFVGSGPAFVLGGFLAAFTLVGALLIFAGLGMLASGLLLFTRLRARIVALAGVAITIALTAYLAIDLSSRPD